jgi:integrase
MGYIRSGMSYVVKKVNGVKRSWKVQYESRASGVRSARDLDGNERFALGFTDLMTIEEARSWCSSLNAKVHLKKKSLEKHLAVVRAREDDVKLNAHFPSVLLQEFETLFVPKDHNKKESHWRCAKKILIEANLSPEDWSYRKQKFYDLFETHNYGISYSQKLIIMINLWGKFLSRKTGKYFDPIPYPSARDKERIIDNHIEERGEFKSEPVSPSMLEKARSKLLEEQYNWIYLSIWLGLRPSEVDRLAEPEGRKTWYVDGGVLWIYQSKLSGLSAGERLKPIPLLLPEQKACVGLIHRKKFRRPLVKTMKRYLGPNVNCYAGRKGFTDLMLSKGYSLEAISQWLGHRNLNRTWQNYKDKKKVLTT